MMRAVRIFYCKILLRLKRRLPATTKGFIQMINTLKRASKLAPWLSVAAILATAGPALAQAPSQAQRDAIKSQCRADYIAHCSSVPPGGAASLQCLEKNKAKLSAGCEKAVSAASGGGAAAAAPAAGAAAAATSAAPTTLVLRPMRPREELLVLRSACGADVRSICGGVQPGGGRIVQCLATNAAQLSPACKDVLSQFAAR